MGIEQKLRDRIASLANESFALGQGDAHGQVRGDLHAAECVAWIGAAEHALALVCPSPTEPYRAAAARIIKQWHGFSANGGVRDLGALLKRLLAEIDQGLLASVANQASAETFDDLLDHAAEYRKENRLDGSSILATAVFEDTLRRICRSKAIPDKDIKTDTLIIALTQGNHITAVMAKRCRAAAGVRNSALHAQWGEITLQDVDAVIALARELLNTHLL